MDEWLGAGDASFIDKAQARLNDRVQGCKILVLASHNFQMLRKVCTAGLVLEEGKRVFLGPVEDAINAYKAIYQALPGYVPRRPAKVARKAAGKVAGKQPAAGKTRPAPAKVEPRR